MKTYLKLLPLLFFYALLFNGCMGAKNTIKPSKNFTTKELKVDFLTQINATIVGNIFYTQSADNNTSVKIYGPDNMVDLVQVAVKDSSLVLTMDKQEQVESSQLTINICSPKLTNINVDGVGNVNIDEHFITPKLNVVCTGVGNVNILNLSCDEVTINSTGVGNIKIKGTAQLGNFLSEGIGNINACDLKTVCVNASSQGVGSISCHAVEALHASLGGVGNIRYKGNPTEKYFKSDGIGSIKAY